MRGLCGRFSTTARMKMGPVVGAAPARHRSQPGVSGLCQQRSQWLKAARAVVDLSSGRGNGANRCSDAAAAAAAADDDDDDAAADESSVCDGKVNGVFHATTGSSEASTHQTVVASRALPRAAADAASAAHRLLGRAPDETVAAEGFQLARARLGGRFQFARLAVVLEPARPSTDRETAKR